MRASLRVLDITDFYSDGVSGGVKTYLHAKAAYLEALGVDHVVVVPGAADEVISWGATRVYRVRGPILPVSTAYRVMLSSRPIADILGHERPDVIEVGSPFLVPRLVSRALGDEVVPTIGFYHADVVRTFAEPYVPSRIAAPLRVMARQVARRFVRGVHSGFDATVAASASVAVDLESLGVPRVHTVSLGVDLQAFRPRERRAAAARPWPVRPGVPVGIYAGRFCAEKRLDVLVAGLKTLAPSERPHLVFVGGGPHLDRLRREAGGSDGITVLGYVSDRIELSQLLNDADFYLAPGPGETFGLSIAEALACGLPVVSVDRGAAPDRVAGSGVGELYGHGDPESAGRALRRMAQRLNPQMRVQAREHAEANYDWADTFDSLVRLYEGLLSGVVC